MGPPRRRAPTSSRSPSSSRLPRRSRAIASTLFQFFRDVLRDAFVKTVFRYVPYFIATQFNCWNRTAPTESYPEMGTRLTA